MGKSPRRETNAPTEDFTEMPEKLDSHKVTAPEECNYFKLVSSEGKIFRLKPEEAQQCDVIKAIVDNEGRYLENASNQLSMSQYSSECVEYVCKYLEFKAKHNGKPPSDKESFPVPEPIAFELLLAANFLQI